MKRVIVAILCGLSVLVWPASAQGPEPYRLYLPLVVRSDMPILCTKPWRLVEPEASSNLVLNPSGEAAGGFAAAGGGAAARVTTVSHYGLQSYRVQTAANAQGISLTTGTLGATAHFVTLRIHGTLPPATRVGIGAASKAPREIEEIDPDWTLYGVAFSAAEASAAVAVTITQAGAGAGDFYIDGIQVEALGHWTSYIDGTQAGCAWAGVAHGSTSERSGQSRAGGQLLDLWDEYHFFTEEMIGVGAAPLVLDVRNYAILPGGELSGQKIEPRQFTLVGRFIAHSEAELHDRRKALIKILSGDTFAEYQPVRLRFDGARVQKTIDAYYQGGLEAELSVTYGTLQTDGEEWRMMQYWTERVSVQFLAQDPMWYEIGESSVLLDTNDNATFRYAAGRLKNTGQWDDLGLTANPTTNGTIRAIAFNPFDGLIYYGGLFTGWDGIAGRDYIVAYDPATDTWSTVGGASDFNGLVLALAVGADGTLYAGGTFTNVNGVANADYIAQKPLGGAWTNLGNPTGGGATVNSVNAIKVDRIGDIIIGGSFTNWSGIANGDYVVKWDTSAGAYAEIVGGGTDTVVAIAITIDNEYYFGGLFTNWGDANGDYVVHYDGTTLNSLSTGMDAIVNALALTNSDLLYLGGFFTTGGGVSVLKVASWNGQAFTPLGEGITTGVDVFSLEVGPDGLLFVGAGFIGVGSLSKWNGASWGQLDVILPSSPIVYTILTINQDAVVPRIYDIFIGFNQTGAGTLGGLVTATNDGTTNVFPKFIVNRSGGTSATILTLRNETLGEELLFDEYGLLDGETLIVDLTPTNKSIISSMFGVRLNAILPNSDFGTWNLQPNDNDVTSFVDVAGAPTVTAWMLWKDTYRSLD